MTGKQLQRTTLLVIFLYVLAIVIGITLYYVDATEKKIHYAVFKDLVPLIFAIPAAYLGFCFQRRSSFLQALRQLWTHLITSVNQAIQYTYQSKTTQKDYSEVLISLSKSIDEVRGVYRNLKETSHEIGLYPFESLKSIHKVVSKLGFGDIDSKEAIRARKQITLDWKNIRKTFLAEFDRSEPTVFDTAYVWNE